jgi:FG-GAP-like repeat
MLLPLIITAAAAHAGTFTAFGPRAYVRGTGAPVTVTDTFTVLNPATQYTLKAFISGLQNTSTELVAGSVVTINGVQVIGPTNLDHNAGEIDVPVTLQSTNTVTVQVHGTPGGTMALQVIGIDNDPPTIKAAVSPLPNAGGWSNSDVTLSFSCSDKTSGISSCPSPITVTTEGANQVVTTTATDRAGNTASVSVTVNLDKTAPAISATITPPPDAGGWNSGPVTVTFACSDALSGVALCQSPVAVNAEGANQVVNGTGVDVAGNLGLVRAVVNISSAYFTIKSYQGKCLDYGSAWGGTGPTVFLNDCSVAHPIRVEEINGRHQVILHAGAQVLGLKSMIGSIGDGTTTAPSEYPLELQAPANRLTIGASSQIFSLDGDSIILSASMPDTPTSPPAVLVAQVKNSRGANGSPIVFAARNLADSEFWDFIAIDNSGKDPTSGFISVSNTQQLLSAFDTVNQIANSNNGAAWGSVIKIIDTGQPIRLYAVSICDDPNYVYPAYACETDGDVHDFAVPVGATVRGDRRGVNLGPRLIGSYTDDQGCANGATGPCELYAGIFVILGNYARITGLRLQGSTQCLADDQAGSPDNCHTSNLLDTWAVRVGGFYDVEPSAVVIDHNDISDWPESSVAVFGGQFGNADSLMCADANQPNLARNEQVHVYRNYMHHNENNDGYGVEFGDGGTATVWGNTFLMNRHSIAGGGDTLEQYAAINNLVLSRRPVYNGEVQQDFDMHGIGQNPSDPNSSHDGGYAGSEVIISGNTFLGGGKENFELRGEPCHTLDYFDGNVSMNGGDQAILVLSYDGAEHDYTFSGSGQPLYMERSGNQLLSSNPGTHLGVGDFDGDGFDDLFLATGTAWYYAPHGQADWRFLSAKTETLDLVLLGDFDGDGRTDVVTLDGQGRLVVSWGGVSDWEVLNSYVTFTGARADVIASMAVGDFVGDTRSDIFFADGSTWWISDGGSQGFVPSATSSFLVKDLRFGDFDGDGKADVFGVVSGTWSYSKSGSGSWSSGVLQANAPISDISQLVVADFDGNGIADVATNRCGFPAECGWRISYGGTQGWMDVSQGYSLIGAHLAGIGYFRGRKPVDAGVADVLSWNDSINISPQAPFPIFEPACDANANANQLCISQSGTQLGVLYSRQDLR